ncbi:hypothetical protein BOX15_Mlig013145g1 [Macrostomum lignano]|uniref:ADP-ribosylation factor-like protein 11 n=1 Tax=Macrostomum lignano TaxID=282301 RepID=A0A267FVI8_9PLAT|nr:hypothetical protein BOX15_Mlig013145g1 [Macrostomum lignano]
MGIGSSSEARSRVIMIGLDSAGKTTLLYKLKSGEVSTSIPTIGFNVETLSLSRSTQLVSWDVGGRCSLRPLWRHYFKDAQGLIFVVDSSDRDRMHEAADELARLLEHDELAGCPLLVLANKKDLPSAMPLAELTERLRVPCLRLNRPFRMFAISASNFDGVAGAFDWLAREVKRRLPGSKDEAQEALGSHGNGKILQLTESLLPKGLQKLLFS